ncbi:putative ribonuclease H-like domain-containing protein [Tanacetum coccineum]|uniref:Ribonuclease H-like domain-containing protein n=1 Tax=Tanacetum coccineum TaxID=301880 RepID=A0ABQ5CUP6_9ASTR
MMISYYTLRGPYEDEMKRTLSSTSNSQNLAFLSSENTSSTNEVGTASGNFGVNTAGGTNSSSQVSSTLGVDEVLCSFFAQQIDQDDLEELDIRWQVAMLTVRVQRFVQKTRKNLDFKGKQHVTFDKSNVECYNCHRKGHFAKECKSGRNQRKRSYGDNGRRNATTNEPSSQALVAQDGQSSDEETTPANDRFSKADGYHAVPPPITGNFLTPRADISLQGNPESILQDHAVVDSGCSSHMTGNKAYLSDYKDYNGGFMAFGSDPKGGKITGKGKIRTTNLDFDDVYFVDELNFKLLDESQVVLRAPRQNGVYSLDLKNIVPSGGITCLYANATTDESKLWHRRLGHVNFKNINKLVKGHLVRGLPSKVFVNDHTCVACKKGKQHKASCKAKLERTIRKPLELLHMDLFGPVLVESINKKKYCLVVTDDFSRFSWVFFLATKDEINEILYKFITGLENQLNHKVKIIRSDHRTEFKNHAMNELCAQKGIKVSLLA